MREAGATGAQVDAKAPSAGTPKEMELAQKCRVTSKLVGGAGHERETSSLLSTRASDATPRAVQVPGVQPQAGVWIEMMRSKRSFIEESGLTAADPVGDVREGAASGHEVERIGLARAALRGVNM
jgi:hypothetical protein